MVDGPIVNATNNQRLPASTSESHADPPYLGDRKTLAEPLKSLLSFSSWWPPVSLGGPMTTTAELEHTRSRLKRQVGRMCRRALAFVTILEACGLRIDVLDCFVTGEKSVTIVPSIE